MMGGIILANFLLVFEEVEINKLTNPSVKTAHLCSFLNSYFTKRMVVQKQQHTLITNATKYQQFSNLVANHFSSQPQAAIEAASHTIIQSLASNIFLADTMI